MSSPRLLAWIAAFVCVLSWKIGSVQAADRIDPSGTWTWVRELEGQEAQSVVTLTYKDGKLTGSYKRMGASSRLPTARSIKTKSALMPTGLGTNRKSAANSKASSVTIKSTAERKFMAASKSSSRTARSRSLGLPDGESTPTTSQEPGNSSSSRRTATPSSRSSN